MKSVCVCVTPLAAARDPPVALWLHARRAHEQRLVARHDCGAARDRRSRHLLAGTEHTPQTSSVVAASRRGRHFHPLQNTQTRRCLAPQVWGRGAHVRPTRVSTVRARTSPRRMLCGMRCAVVRHHAAPITSHILPLSRVPTDERRRTGMTTISAVDEDRAGLARRRARVRAPAERGGLPRDDRGGWWDLAMTCVT